MIVESIELYANVLADTGFGVNAQITTLVAGGYIDATRAPGVATIGTETLDPSAAIGRNLDATRSVVVFFAGADAGDTVGEINYLTASIALGVRIDVTENQPQITTSELGYLIRAISRSTRWWFRTASQSNLYQTLNGVQIVGPVSYRPATYAPTPQSPVNTFGVRLVVECRDALP